jgi:hypothetical protein
MAVCTTEGCASPVRCRGLCTAHYSKFRREHAAPSGPCSMEDCASASLARGWCRAHYYRWKRHGDPSILLLHPQGPTCSISECAAKPLARDLCAKHYSRFMKHGDPLVSLTAEWGSGTIHPSGYRIHHRGSTFSKEHRAVMERHLGRPLLSTEHVHHINHIKTDNRIDNLMIVTPAEHARIHKRLPENTASTKRCPKCQLVLAHEAFNRNRARHDGLSPYCRACRCRRDG